MQYPPKRILIIYDNRRNEMILTDKQHLRVLEHSHIPHQLVYLNFADLAPSGGLDDPVANPPEDILETQFDAVILHYAFLSLRTTGQIFYKWKQASDWIRKLNCRKIAIPQDEIDHAGILDDWLFDWEVDTVFSVHYKPDGPLYPRTRTCAKIHNCLPGYINDESARHCATNISKHSQRPLDIVYRANHLPYWYGSHAQLKHGIAIEVQKRAKIHNLRIDISTSNKDVIDGEKWLDFMASARCAIGGEGGRSVLDQCGEMKAQVNALLLKHPDATFEQITNGMPEGWDDYHFLTITPRHLEAVITKTCQLLIKGDYKGILEAGKHYISIKPDFSDLDSALELLNDHSFCENMAEQAYEDIYLSGKYSYRTFANLIEQVFYEPTNSSPIGDNMNPQFKQKAEVEALERELVSTRHQNILIHAQLQIAQSQLEVARSQMRGVQAQLDSLNRRLIIRVGVWLITHLWALILVIMFGILLLLGFFVTVVVITNRYF